MPKISFAIPLHALLTILLTIYSYALVDPNITLVNHPLWEKFRNIMVSFGYYNRPLSAFVYVVLVLLLFIIHLLLTRQKKISALKIAITISSILIFSYPFLSYDFFNYLFDAKILTFYKKNPYLYAPQDFSPDPWLRFMHWVHRKYPYGPSFLILTAIPSLFSFSKFILSYLFTKLTFILSFLLAVYLIEKRDKKSALFYTTHPLVIIEGLVNFHNDFPAVNLALTAIYLPKKRILKFILLLTSGLIKYISLPALLLLSKKIYFKLLSFLLILAALFYLSFFREIQPWYFLNLFIFLSFLRKRSCFFQIFFLSLLLSYYPYLRFSGWAQQSSVSLKHSIIMTGAAIQTGVIAYYLLIKDKSLFKKI